MELLLLLLIIVTILYLSAERVKKLKNRQALEQVKADWQSIRQRKERYNFVKIDRYLDTSQAQFHRLTDQTIEDLDFEKLFKFIDKTTSKIGQQFLYKKLLEPSNRTQDESEKYIRLFTENKEQREKTQAALLTLANDDA